MRGDCEATSGHVLNRGGHVVLATHSLSSCLPSVIDMTHAPVIPALIDTPITQAAIRLAQSTESESVFNHSVRSYLFAELLAARDGMHAGDEYDSETLFLGCLLHDLGAGSAAPGKERFEVEGADLAATLLTEHGCDRVVVDAVWEAIALHTSFGIANRRGPVCYLVNGGVGMDFGRDADFVDDQTAEAIHARYPRLSMATTLLDAITAHAQLSPEAAPPYSFPLGVLQERRTNGITVVEQMAAFGRWGS